MGSLRRQRWHQVVVPCVMAVYLIVAYTRYLRYQPELFPFSAWGMFAVQDRMVAEYEVAALSAARCRDIGGPTDPELPASPLPLDGSERQLAAAVYRLESRGAGREAEHFRALLEHDLLHRQRLEPGACYEVVGVKLDSWSRPPGERHLRGRSGPYQAGEAAVDPAFRVMKGRGKLGPSKPRWFDKKRKRP